MDVSLKNIIMGDAVPDLNVERFVFLNPFGGEIYHTGSTVAIYWTGGPPLPSASAFR